MDWDAVCGKWCEQGYASLTRQERLWLDTRAFIDSVNNGGLVSFFYNSHAERYDETVSALQELNALEVVQVLQWYGSLFGDKVPTDLDERNATIGSWNDQVLKAIDSADVDEKLYSLFDDREDSLESYLVTHGFNPC